MTSLPSSNRAILRLLWGNAALVVVVASFLPPWSLPMRVLHYFHMGDKFQHFACYAILAFLPSLHESWRTLGLCVTTMMLMGILIETGQLSTYRVFDYGDVAANAVGLFGGIVLGTPLRPFARTERD